MGFRVLVTAPYFQPVLDRFRAAFDKAAVELITPPVRERMDEEELLRWIADIDGAICGDDRFTEKVLSNAPRLKVISKWGTGIDSIDKVAAERRGIKVLNTPDAFSHAVADSVLGYIVCFARKLPEMDRRMRGGEWAKVPSVSLLECTLGVIGVGNVGKQVVRRAKAFGMTLLGNDLVEMPAAFLAETGIQMVPKEELYRKADFVSVNCDLNETSFHLINDTSLGLMKKSAYLINTARGPIVEEAALVRALGAERIAGAALDVFEVEPLPAESGLWRFENVMVSAHNANSSPAAWERVHRSTIKNLFIGLGIAHAEEIES